MILCNHPKDVNVLWVWSKVTLLTKGVLVPLNFSGSDSGYLSDMEYFRLCTVGLEFTKQCYNKM